MLRSSRLVGLLLATVLAVGPAWGQTIGPSPGSSASGSVTSVGTGNGLTGGPITASGTITAAVVAPQGRCTLQTGVPVMTNDQTAKSTVFYDTYIGNQVPVYDGTNTVPLTIGSNEISLVLNATDNTSGHEYDVFAFSNSGTLTIGTGPAWTDDATRSAAIALKNGVWTNNASVVLRSNGSSLGTITANKATYLCTLRTTANAQTGMAFQPSPAAGGTANILGLYNAYNRVPILAANQDSTGSWTTTTNTWQPLNVGATGSGLNNRISFIDGLGQSAVSANALIGAATSIAADSAGVGVDFNSASATPLYEGVSAGLAASSDFRPTPAVGVFGPALGFNFCQLMQIQNTGGTATFAGGIVEIFTVSLGM